MSRRLLALFKMRLPGEEAQDTKAYNCHQPKLEILLSSRQVYVDIDIEDETANKLPKGSHH